MERDKIIAEPVEGFVAVTTAGQLFGLALPCVRDVFVPRGLTKVPLAPPEIAGVLNLRGRVVTAISLRARLGLAASGAGSEPLAVGIERHGELYGIVVDRVGDVQWLKRSAYEPNPVNLDRKWRAMCNGVYRLDDGLMAVLDVDKVLDLTHGRDAA